MPAARQHVARARPGDPDEVRRFMRPVAELLVERIKSGETLDPEIDLHRDNIDYSSTPSARTGAKAGDTKRSGC